MQIKKIMVSFLALACLCTNFNVVAHAETVDVLVDDEISLAYEIANNPISDLDIADSTAYCTSIVGGDNVVSIAVTQTLQKYRGLWVWKNVDGAEWTETENCNSIYLSNSKSNLDSGTYRVKSVFKLTDNNGKTETVTIYSSEKKVS